MKMERGSQISLDYLPGEQNVDADMASRWVVSRVEFQLDPQLFQQLDRRWGPHSVDAFASRLNKQMIPFWSRLERESQASIRGNRFDQLQPDCILVDFR